MRIYMCIYIYIYMYIYIHIYVYIHIHICVCVCVYIYIYTHINIYIYMYMYISLYMYVCCSLWWPRGPFVFGCLLFSKRSATHPSALVRFMSLGLVNPLPRPLISNQPFCFWLLYCSSCLFAISCVYLACICFIVLVGALGDPGIFEQ